MAFNQQKHISTDGTAKPPHRFRKQRRRKDHASSTADWERSRLVGLTDDKLLEAALLESHRGLDNTPIFEELETRFGRDRAYFLLSSSGPDGTALAEQQWGQTPVTPSWQDADLTLEPPQPVQLTLRNRR